MLPLALVSLLWAFSFGIIKDSLSGIDSSFVAFFRLLLSFLVFLPLLRLRRTPGKLWLPMLVIGAFQFGLMYVTYIQAFAYLLAYEVALFTIFTPIYVSIINDLFNHHFDPITLILAFLAVVGTGIVQYGKSIESQWFTGFLLVQVSNVSFALGQVLYKKVLSPYPELMDWQVISMPYFGGALLTGLAALFFTKWSSLVLNPRAWGALVYLGVVASGIGFFLWNYGARKVNTGTLAIFNDLKVPFAVAVSLLVFGETTNLGRLFLGGGIVMASLIMNEARERNLSRKITI
jgi:carboxylate/amino acid/amine transporter